MMKSIGFSVRRLLSWVRRHPWRATGIVLLACFTLLNFLAYQHARAMLNFSGDAERTPPPQSLSYWPKSKVLVFGVTVPRPKNDRSPKDLGLAAETVRFWSKDGLDLEAWLLTPPNPKGTVLLFHGYAASRSTLLEQGRVFHDLGFTAMLIDFRGSGGSDGSATTLGYQEAEDVAAAVRYARVRGLPGPLILYGQSMGGAALLRSIAVLEVKPDGIILESVFGRMLGAVRNRFSLMGVPSFPAASLLVFWGGVQLGFSGFSHNPEEYAQACDCPALVMHGAEDRHALVAEAESVFEHLRGSKELIVFPEASHGPLFKASPHRWRDTVGRFLARQVKASPRPED